MSTYDATGLSMDRYAQILSDMIDAVVAWKGESISTDEKELLGHMLRQISYQSDGQNEKIQQIYDAMSVANNTGVPLDNFLELIGLDRQSASASTATLTCTVSKAATIPAGSTAKTDANVYFTTDTALVFAGAGSSDVAATCTESGPYNAAIGEIDNIVTSVDGWTTVTNAAAAIPGRNRETDAELKLRHTTAVDTSGERDAASISEAVGNVSGVSAVLVIEDYSETWPVFVYVIGGSDSEVAAAIDGQTTIGIGTSGTTIVDVYNIDLKQDRTIRFTRALDLDIYIDLDIQVTDLFPADGDDQIKAALASFFDGNNIGEDVLYNQLFSPIYTIPGCIVSVMQIGITPSPTGTSDIAVSNTQRAVIDSANIVITHV